MQVALTVWEGRISPLCDVTRMLLVVHIQDGRVADRRQEPFDFESALSRAARLSDMGVDVLICGGITNFFANAIEALGVQIIPFSAGPVDAVLEAYLTGKIHRRKYRMPGCETLQRACSPQYTKPITKEVQKMKIAISSSGPTLDDQVEARFGRCPYFLIVDPATMDCESMPNPNIALGGGAGPQSAQLMAANGVSAVLTGNCGPNAYQTFGAAGIQVITGVGGRVRDAVAQFNAGQLRQASEPTVQNHFGMGGGRGMGGGGRGMGGGGGRGMGGGGGQGMGGRRGTGGGTK
jgi:predicted Fe-Mo cluster-binding NifX family protein